MEINNSMYNMKPTHYIYIYIFEVTDCLSYEFVFNLLKPSTDLNCNYEILNNTESGKISNSIECLRI